MRSRSPALILLMIVAANDAGAQVVPDGGQFQVNSYTTAKQFAAEVASDFSGNFVVVWESYQSDGTDSSSSSIQAQRYSVYRVPLGSQFQVNTYTTDFQGSPAVASDAAGNFVVVWESYGSVGPDSSSRSIQGQRFSSDGAPVGSQFQVNSYSTGQQAVAKVASDPVGNFVVTWMSALADSDASDGSIQAQRYDSAGAPLGGQFQVNTYTTGQQGISSLAVDAQGSLVVVWTSVGSPGSDSSITSIQAQRYSSSGVPVGGQFQVNSYGTGVQTSPAVATDQAGKLIVVWSSVGSSGTDSSSMSVQAQRYSVDGAALGSEFQVNSYTTNGQYEPDVVADSRGNFIVTWVSNGSFGTDSSGSSVQAKRFNLAGQVTNSDFQINTFSTLAQYRASVASDSTGNFVVAWQSDGSFDTDSSDFSIQAQRYDVNLIFRDGFESESTVRWSQTSP